MSGKTGQYVVTYDNGSGYYEWASSPQDTIAQAWEASGLKPGQTVAGGEVRLEVVTEPGVSAPINQPYYDYPRMSDGGCLACSGIGCPTCNFTGGY